jgi:hypothetical protein
MAQTLIQPTGLAGRLRRALRNPSIPVTVWTIVAVIAVLAAIFGPGLVRSATENIREQRRLHSPPIIAPIAGAQINPWLRNNARRLMDATTPIEWRGVNFQSGSCYAENLSLLPKDKWSAAIIEACHRLDGIQARYESSCVSADACLVPAEAKRELQAVIDYLVAAYADAGYVLPYQVEEQSQ